MMPDTDYDSLLAQAKGLFEGEHDKIANAANLTALVYNAIPGLNWVGFYFFDGKELVLGPFQGKPACIRIALNKGVCGTAAATRRIQRVDDVHTFDGHIACDADSNSELVVPLVRHGELVGVWDVDSPLLARFTAKDEAGMQALCSLFLESYQ